MINFKKNRSLILGAGFNSTFVRRIDRFEEVEHPSKIIIYSYESLRDDIVIQPTITLQWEDMLGKHFGYRIGFTSLPYFIFSPYKMKIVEDIRDYQDFPEEEYTYENETDISKNEIKKERVRHSSVNLNISIIYIL